MSNNTANMMNTVAILLVMAMTGIYLSASPNHRRSVYAVRFIGLAEMTKGLSEVK